MANYNGTFRSNCFRVNDEKTYQKLLKGLSGEDICTEDYNDGTHFIGGYCFPDYFPPASYYDAEYAELVNKANAGNLFDKNDNPVTADAIDNYDELYDESGEKAFDRYDDCGNMDIFYDEIQQILPDKEAFVLYTIAQEKLRQVDGWVVVVTSQDIASMSLFDFVSDYVDKNGINKIVM